MLTNTRLVKRFGVRGTTRKAVVGYTGVALGLLVVTVVGNGTPPFSIALIGLSAVLVMHATMIPNLNTIALEPLGHIAGTASAIIGTISLAGGALLGSLVDRSLGDTITPLVVAFVVYGSIAAGWVAWAEAGRIRRTAAVPVPPAGGGD
jgi:DHA1 family bicyclomycin/chloramphenicol resistance-like MFS transporter